ncbi:(Fe-S)-binding protein [Desulfoluna spongiiphila]|uniref:Fe-S oxidoreductase n=1 Tax=Desulfoluna spongiiphila TaxID=419481 RepID=A0A1G5JME7_9BACT|nr:(Fe-S)-binding protein [Desulfoluna spongiiphila]SCY89565.1 Fe-S oxidoreductase [Desulfoluna spongiiphila]VVS93031.1 alpha-helical ferredoxin [Desulfoluna spongiiphila]
MEHLISPAHSMILGFIPGWLISFLYVVVGVGIFAYIIAKRLAPLVKAAPDNSRFSNIPARLKNVFVVWLGQIKQPRYMFAGVLHIMIFFGFLTLALRTCSLVVIGMFPDFALPGLAADQPLGAVYNVLKDYAATIVFFACFVAAIRRGVFKPARYAVPEKYGHDHTAEAVFVCCIIMGLMLTESLFEAVLVAAGHEAFLAPLTLAWAFSKIFAGAPHGLLQFLHVLSYYCHDTLFFFFLCFLPLGKHFHVITSLFNVLFMRVQRGNIKPVVYGITAEGLDDLESFGVKKIEDFTWKHMLDFYTCADCGRCSDQCPANLVGRPLSPRFITIKARDYMFKNYPLRGDLKKSEPLVGSIYTADEIWSCTTCGACEQECPLGIEYIDKIVDLRRGLVDEGEVPQTLQKPMKALGKRGNPWGKVEKKRADWTKDKEFAEECSVKIMDNGDTTDTLYFVDSITSYDDRMVNIAKCTSKILDAAGEDFFIIGKQEKDSGNEVVRFGEEMLFQQLKEQNVEAINESGAKKIIASDPHAYNALKNDYPELDLPVEHISEVIVKKVKDGTLKLKPIEDPTKVYTYHDPCYLGRHNGIYDDPRDAMAAIPGLKMVEMEKNRDRSLCCSGGGLMLFYEPHEEERMAVLRVQMAHEAGANVIVCACPFCMVNMEDAIKVAGLDDQLEAIELTELIDQHMEK